MKSKINRILVISMLIGFCLSSTNLKSQLVQPNYPFSLLLEKDTHDTYNNWFSLGYLFETEWSSEVNKTPKGDSLKNMLEIKCKREGVKDSVIPELNRSPVLKTRKKNFRNKPVIIQTRI